MRRVGTILVVLAFVSLMASAAFAEGGADLYKTKCAACHGADGSGNTPMGKKLGLKDFKSPDVVKQTDAQLIEITTKGKDKMPAFAGKLTDAQIKDVVAYIRELQKKK
jgi:mono/diheme cytochrome c family protein